MWSCKKNFKRIRRITWQWCHRFDLRSSSFKLKRKWHFKCSQCSYFPPRPYLLPFFLVIFLFFFSKRASIIWYREKKYLKSHQWRPIKRTQDNNKIKWNEKCWSVLETALQFQRNAGAFTSISILSIQCGIKWKHKGIIINIYKVSYKILW